MNQAIRTADEALAVLMDAFLQLDTAQRTAKGYADKYAEVLPRRAQTSGLVPRFRILDEAAHAHVAEYLKVLDTHPLAPNMRPEAANAALQAFRYLEPRLRRVAGDIDQFILDYDAEFRRVGRELASYEREKEAARTALQRATAVWQSLRSQGFESRHADEGLAKARVAGRAVEAWLPERGFDELRKTTSLLMGFVDDVERVAAEFPGLVRRAQRRAPALKTRVEAISTRANRIPEDLGALRREFSGGNWADLDMNEERVRELLDQVQGLMSRFQLALTEERWNEALVELEQTELALASADQAVDAPRDRLFALREFKADPKPQLDRARFAIRDAQMLVVRGPEGSTSVAAKQLDRLVLRIGSVGEGLAGVHPDYWAALVELQQVRSDVKMIVSRYRQTPR